MSAWTALEGEFHFEATLLAPPGTEILLHERTTRHASWSFKGLLANQLLTEPLQKHGYFKCQFTPGLWKHVWRPITFTLVVDDFGIKSDALTHTNHLKRTLEKCYEVKVDWKGSIYVGIQLGWNYDKGYVDTHMPG